MAGAQGTATLSFPVDAQPAQYVTSTVVTDSYPNPNQLGWAQRTLPVSANWSNIVYGNNTFVAISSGSAIAATSADGITWMQRAMPISAGWVSIAYGNGIFVALTSNSNIGATSTDGITWTQRTLPISAAFYALAFGNGVFVAVQYNTTGTSFTSTDGVTWTAGGVTPPNTNLIAYGAGLFVVLGASGGTARTSPDGITWTVQTYPMNAVPRRIIFGNGLFVAVANGTQVATSQDGINWQLASLPVTGAWNVVYGNNSYLALGGTSALTSNDGFYWIPRVQNLAVGPFDYGNGLFAGLVANTAIAATTPDGITTGVPLPNVRTITTVNTQIVPAHPVVGSNIASVTVTGQTGLLTTSTVDAWMQANDSTASHNAYEHGIAPIKLTTGELIAGTGFTITGVSDQRIDGDFIVHWIWRD